VHLKCGLESNVGLISLNGNVFSMLAVYIWVRESQLAFGGYAVHGYKLAFEMWTLYKLFVSKKLYKRFPK